MMIEELFYRYLRENMTAEEFRDFRDWATKETNRAELNRLLAQWIDRDLQAPQQEEIDVEALYLDLIRKEQIPAGEINSSNPQDQPLSLAQDARNTQNPSSHRIPGIFRIAIAAAAVFLLILTGFFLFRSSPIKTQPLIAQSAPITPGANKAVLTLANGQQIVLDSAANGSLAVQGNMQIIKMAGGQLAYQPASSDNTGPDHSAAHPLMYNEVATPRGGYYQLILPDGSKVWLNAASSIRYPTTFTGKERSVQVSGEAYFEITSNAHQPFTIVNNGVTVQVLGTSFNLMAYPDEDLIRTTLVSGSIQVSHDNGYQKISPGQQVSWAPGGRRWQLSTPDLHEVLAWKEGEFRFEGQKIAAIMRQIARWYDVEVEYKGDQPHNEFNGVIPRKKEVTELLTVLEQTDAVHFTVIGRKIIVESLNRNNIHHPN